MTTTWKIELPPAIKFYTLNRPPTHWGSEQRSRQELKKAAWVMALKQQIPTLQRVGLTIEYQPPAAWRYGDPDNLAPVGKGIIDGLKAAKVVPDDKSEHVTSVAYTIGDRFPKGRFVVHIIDLAPVEVPGD